MLSTLITGGTILTMDPDRKTIDSGAVLVEGERITSVGPASELEDRYPDAIRFKAVGKIVMPGLINSHVHAAQILLRGGPSQDQAHLEWLVNVLYPGIQAYDEEAMRIAYVLFCVEAIGSGTTTVVDNAIWGERDDMTRIALDTLKTVGIRAVYARMFTDTPAPDQERLVKIMQLKEPKVRKANFPREETEQVLVSIEDLMRKYNDVEPGLLQVWPAPGIPLFVSPPGLAGALELSRKFNTLFTIHLAETQATSGYDGISVVEYLAAVGALDARLLAAHCVWVNDRDLRLMQQHDVKVAHNVVSNMFLGSGIAPVSKMVDLGISVGLGTDDVNCNNSANMFSDMKFAALAQKAKQLDAAAITAERVLEMATIEGAKAIGMQAEIGSIEPGKQADLVILNADLPHLAPCYHIPSTLVYQARGSEVEAVMVNGAWLVQDQQPLFLERFSLGNLREAAQQASVRVLQRAGMDHMRNRGWLRSIG